MTGSPSFQQLFAKIDAGDEQAAKELFSRYANRLIGLAYNRLDSRIRQKVEPEDVVQSVFKSFFQRQAEGKFELCSWEGLWGLLATITLRKCGRKIDAFRSAGRDINREIAAATEDSRASWQAVARDPTPVEAVILSETVEQLMASLGQQDQEIVALALQGYSTAEISAKIGRAERTVRRKVQATRERLVQMRDENLNS